MIALSRTALTSSRGKLLFGPLPISCRRGKLRRREVRKMKDFDSFLAQIAEKPDFTAKLAETAKSLSDQQVVEVLQILLSVLREYDEWSRR